MQSKDVQFGQFIHDGVKISKGTKLQSFGFEFVQSNLKEILYYVWVACNLMIIRTRVSQNYLVMLRLISRGSLLKTSVLK